MEGTTLTDDRVICDSCGQQTDVELWTRLIAKDRNGYDVTEQYFECKNCGKHYTVGVYDRQMRLDIQKRRQIQAQIRLHRQIGSRPGTIQHFIRKEENLKDKMLRRSQELKERYREECGNGTDNSDNY